MFKIARVAIGDTIFMYSFAITPLEQTKLNHALRLLQGSSRNEINPLDKARAKKHYQFFSGDPENKQSSDLTEKIEIEGKNSSKQTFKLTRKIEIEIQI